MIPESTGRAVGSEAGKGRQHIRGAFANKVSLWETASFSGQLWEAVEIGFPLSW